MDTSKGNGKKILPVIFYIFAIIAGINILILIHYYVVVGLLEYLNTWEYLLICSIICIPLECLIFLFAAIYYCVKQHNVYGLKYMIFIQVLIILSTIYFPSCDWSDKKKQSYINEYYKTGVIANLNIDIIGFTNSEIEKILVRQIHNGEITDTFFIKPEIIRHDSTIFYLKISPIYIHDTYQIVISNEIFTLSDMRIALHALWSMTSVNYECRVNECKINGRVFKYDENNDNLVIINKLQTNF